MRLTILFKWLSSGRSNWRKRVMISSKPSDAKKHSGQPSNVHSLSAIRRKKFK
jgi:hypothetical protein